jgi:cellulose synthase/poly-beta-1,6-N-acetylglucosamine synthase-like glycosyltransferase
MLNALLIPVGALYVLTISLLFVYGINFFYMTYLATSRQRKSVGTAALLKYPKVTIQLPIYNELYVASRLVMAAARLVYPADQLEIQVLDDSSDETAENLNALVRQLQEQGVNIQHIHRMHRSGYKAGALANGLSVAQGEFLAIFDSDFIPQPDFLQKIIPLFTNPKLAFVQARWGHLNSHDSLLTYIQSLAIDAHFMIEQTARSRGGFWFNFNGTAGVWRKEAIYSAGGWKADTLTEDLDLSYRSFLAGWEAAYTREVIVPGELPASFNAFRRQQHRWARGSFECFSKLLPKVWKTKLPLGSKVESTLHLGGYGVHLLLFAISLLYPFVLLLVRQYPNLINLMGFSYLFNLTAFAPTVFFVAAQRELKRNWIKQVPGILFMTVIGCGMMVNTLQAALQVLFKRPARFERTPKFGNNQHPGDWMRREKYQLNIDPVVIAEIGLAGWNAGTIGLAISLHIWGIAFYALVFVLGLLFVAGLSIVQTIGVKQRGLKPAAQGE